MENGNNNITRNSVMIDNTKYWCKQFIIKNIKAIVLSNCVSLHGPWSAVSETEGREQRFQQVHGRSGLQPREGWRCSRTWVVKGVLVIAPRWNGKSLSVVCVRHLGPLWETSGVQVCSNSRIEPCQLVPLSWRQKHLKKRFWLGCISGCDAHGCRR